MQPASTAYVNETDEHRWFPVWAVAAILKRPDRTIRTWVDAGKVPSKRDPQTGALLVDGKAATLHHEQTPTRQRTVIDTVKSSKSSCSSSTRVSTDRVLSRFQGQGVAVVNDQPETQPEIVVPVRLDLDQAERQLVDFCNKVRTSLASAVASGLAVHSLTVSLEGPQQ